MFVYIAEYLGSLIINSFFIGFRILDFFIFSRPGYNAKMYCSQGEVDMFDILYSLVKYEGDRKEGRHA